MSSICVSESTKKKWDDSKPDDLTHDEFALELLEVYRTFNGEPVDVDELAEALESTLIPMTEVAAFRGAREAIDSEK